MIVGNQLATVVPKLFTRLVKPVVKSAGIDNVQEPSMIIWTILNKRHIEMQAFIITWSNISFSFSNMNNST